MTFVLFGIDIIVYACEMPEDDKIYLERNVLMQTYTLRRPLQYDLADLLFKGFRASQSDISSGNKM